MEDLGEPSFSYGRRLSPSKDADLKSSTPPGEPSLSYGPNLGPRKTEDAVLNPSHLHTSS